VQAHKQIEQWELRINFAFNAVRKQKLNIYLYIYIYVTVSRHRRFHFIGYWTFRFRTRGEIDHHISWSVLFRLPINYDYDFDSHESALCLGDTRTHSEFILEEHGKIISRKIYILDLKHYHHDVLSNKKKYNL